MGLAPLLPSIITWGDSYIPMTNGNAISVVLSGLALAELAVPQMFAAASLGDGGTGSGRSALGQAALEATASTKMGFALSGASTIALLLFLSAFALGRKHGSR